MGYVDSPSLYFRCTKSFAAPAFAESVLDDFAIGGFYGWIWSRAFQKRYEDLQSE